MILFGEATEEAIARLREEVVEDVRRRLDADDL